MTWQEWCSWKNRKYVAGTLFAAAYVVTIPIRGYEFLDGLVDTSQGVPLWVHLVIIVIGGIAVSILHIVLGIVVQRLLDRA